MTQSVKAPRLFLRLAVILLAASLATACASSQSNRTTLFSDPQSIDGTITTACGRMHFTFENHNFYPSESQTRDGMSGVGVAPGEVADDQLRTYHNDRVCLTGRVRYSGCGETSICTGSMFPYEVVVDDLSVY